MSHVGLQRARQVVGGLLESIRRDRAERPWLLLLPPPLCFVPPRTVEKKSRPNIDESAVFALGALLAPV